MSNLFDQVHNYCESLVFNEINRRSESWPHFTPDMLSDVACVVLNRIQSRYVRHDADFMFYLTAIERAAIDNSVASAVDLAFQYVSERVSKGSA